MSAAAFHVAFDRLHREMRLLLQDGGATFDAGITGLARRRLLRGDEVRFLDICRTTRNFLLHAHDALADGVVRVQVDPTAVRRLVEIADRIGRRVPVARIAVPWARVRCGRLDEALEPLMAEMLARDFSHVPILVNGAMAAVFDERALFRALAGDRLDAVTPQTRVRDVVDALSPQDGSLETTGVLFAPRRISLSDLRHRLAAADDRDRISLIVLTEDGAPDQRPLGLLTIWDLPDDR